MGAHVQLPLAVNSKSEQKVDSLPLLGLKPATLDPQAHLSDRSANSHPQIDKRTIWVGKFVGLFVNYHHCLTTIPGTMFLTFLACDLRLALK
jgi:hypothetical protein